MSFCSGSFVKSGRPVLKAIHMFLWTTMGIFKKFVTNIRNEYFARTSRISRAGVSDVSVSTSVSVLWSYDHYLTIQRLPMIPFQLE